MLTTTWTSATLSDVCDNGPGYMYSLLCDYERYVRDFGYIPIAMFIPGWNNITYKEFVNLSPSDIVFTPNGIKYIVVDDPYESDDETRMYVEVVKLNDDGSYDDTGKSNETLETGDLYCVSFVHRDYRRKRLKKESEEPICPILITKTNQPQN